MSIQHFQTKLGITKYSIVTNSNDSVTLRLMTEHDLAMLYEWLNYLISSSGGGEEARPTLADVQEQYLPSVLAQESVTPYIAMLNGGADWVCPAVRCSEAGTDGGKKKPIQEYAE